MDLMVLCIESLSSCFIDSAALMNSCDHIHEGDSWARSIMTCSVNRSWFLESIVCVKIKFYTS